MSGADLVILDDFFPNLLTGFRVAEYNALLQALPGLRIVSALPDFAPRHAEYAALYPELAPRIEPWQGHLPAHARRAYLNFLNNAVLFLPALEAAQAPFWLTLYPGGGFGLDEPESDEKLRRVLASPLLQGLIVTQPVTEDYVRGFAQRHGLRLPALERVPGVVVNPLYFEPEPTPRHWYGQRGPQAKSALEVAFVAEKYMPQGLNKGFPAFIEAHRALAGEGRLRWHVVGSFGPHDLPAPAGPHHAITWHGRLHTAELRTFLSGVDMVVSPNRPRLLHPGNFDGFPTGACVEASLCGALVAASDELGQNPGYAHGREMFIIEPTAQAIRDLLEALLEQPARVAEVARAGRERTRTLYHPSRQIGPRLELLRKWSQMQVPPRP